jgi:predicted AlkP superfamily phosphohydrolase/phosphomutase
MILVLGIDAATWTVITPNLNRLENLARLCRLGRCKELVLREKPLSAPVWCGMFSGKLPAEHHHHSYVVNGNIVRRQDLHFDFVWDVLARAGKTAKAMNIPFVVPPYSFGVDFRPVGFGLPTNEKEWDEEIRQVTEKTREIMAECPDLLVSVYTLLDRVQHFHWGSGCVLEWYERLDRRLGELLFASGFVDDPGNRLILISDHGFCAFGEAKVQTLPEETPEGRLQGDHHENAVLITLNVDYEIAQPQDVCRAVLHHAL